MSGVIPEAPRKFPNSAEDYELFEEIGEGVSACVYRAQCIPLGEIVAIKVLDLEKQNCDLKNISQEAKTMLLVDHPNVLRAHCSFVNNRYLWVVMPYMAGGSCLHILKAAFPDGFKESVIATLLREVLKGLHYLHTQGHIHRDVKAGNILVDARGKIKLGDFGVSACLFESGDRQRHRNTFVGTPCWMAPEVLEQLHGYDFKADIWSFGITALELAHGHAPFSKYPPMKVLLMTLQNAPPTLSDEKGKKFSKSFKHMIAMCLVKDPSKRPTCQKLLKHTFFNKARSSDYITRNILEGLPSLGDRVRTLKTNEEDMLAQKMADGRNDELSQSEYKRGISSWNFDLEDLKIRAALEVDEYLNEKDVGECSNSLFEVANFKDKISLSVSPSFASRDDINDVLHSKSANSASIDHATINQRLTSLGTEKECEVGNPSDQIIANVVHEDANLMENSSNQNCNVDVDGGVSNHASIPPCHHRKGSTSSCASDATESGLVLNLNHNGVCDNGIVPVADNSSLEVISKQPKLAGSSVDDVDGKSKGGIVQQKGRFKVTSDNLETEKASPPIIMPKSYSMQAISQLPAASLSSPPGLVSNQPGNQFLSQLLSMLQMNVIQRDCILNLMKQVSIGDTSATQPTDIAKLLSPNLNEKSLLELAHEKEKELLQEISDLQWRLACSQEEILRLKTRNAQVPRASPIARTMVNGERNDIPLNVGDDAMRVHITEMKTNL